MVRVEAASKPVVNVEAERRQIRRLKEQIRSRVRGSSPATRPLHLCWNTVLPRLVITSDTTDFDATIISRFQTEGFQIFYLPYRGDQKHYHNQLQRLAEPLDGGDRYAIIGT
jgi:hypothetical protein